MNLTKMVIACNIKINQRVNGNLYGDSEKLYFIPKPNATKYDVYTGNKIAIGRETQADRCKLHQTKSK